MKKFIALYHLSAEAIEADEIMEMTETQWDEVMKVWGSMEGKMRRFNDRFGSTIWRRP